VGTGYDAQTISYFDNANTFFYDVNLDGVLDVVSFAADGVYISMFHNGVLGDMVKVSEHFGANSLSEWALYEPIEQGNDRFSINGLQPRTLADVTGDGVLDIVGFGEDGVRVTPLHVVNNQAAPQLRIRDSQIGDVIDLGANYYGIYQDIDGNGTLDIVIRDKTTHQIAGTQYMGKNGSSNFIELGNDVRFFEENDALLHEDIVTGNEVGKVAGSHEISALGAFNYNLPIDIPKGSENLTPALSLAYNSNSVNGLLGIGFSMQMNPVISRCATHERWGEIADPVDYDDNDQFCLNGQRLVEYSPDRYRLREGEGPFEIRRDVDGNNVERFIVYYQSGVIGYFGTANAARIFKNDGTEKSSQPSPVFAWALNHLVDPYGREVRYNYSVDRAAGTQLLHTIQYNGYSLEFIYQQRPDPQNGVAAVGGPWIRKQDRLKRIQVLNRSDDIVNEFVFSYTSNSKQQTLLRAVTQCNGAGKCVPATVFDWEQTPVTRTPIQAQGPVLWVAGTETDGGQDLARTKFGDYNGDGRADLYHVNGIANDTTHQLWYATEQEGVFERADGATVWTGTRQYNTTIERILTGDFDGDGKTELYLAGLMAMAYQIFGISQVGASTAPVPYGLWTALVR